MTSDSLANLEQYTLTLWIIHWTYPSHYWPISIIFNLFLMIFELFKFDFSLSDTSIWNYYTSPTYIQPIQIYLTYYRPISTIFNHFPFLFIFAVIDIPIFWLFIVLAVQIITIPLGLPFQWIISHIQSLQCHFDLSEVIFTYILLSTLMFTHNNIVSHHDRQQWPWGPPQLLTSPLAPWWQPEMMYHNHNHNPPQ